MHSSRAEPERLVGGERNDWCRRGCHALRSWPVWATRTRFSSSSSMPGNCASAPIPEKPGWRPRGRGRARHGRSDRRVDLEPLVDDAQTVPGRDARRRAGLVAGRRRWAHRPVTAVRPHIPRPAGSAPPPRLWSGSATTHSANAPKPQPATTPPPCAEPRPAGEERPPPGSPAFCMNFLVVYGV